MPCVFLPPKRCKTLDASLFEKLQVLNDLEGEQRQLRDLKAIVDAHKLQAGLMSSLQRWCHICWYGSYPAMVTQADRRLGDLYTSLASIEDLWVSTLHPVIVWFQSLNATQACYQEQLRDKDRRRTNDADEQRALFEGLQNRLMELQVGFRNGNVKISTVFFYFGKVCKLLRSRFARSQWKIRICLWQVWNH